jgi:hypothetical protein
MTHGEIGHECLVDAACWYIPRREVTAMIAALRRTWTRLGRELRRANEAAGSLRRQPGERLNPWMALLAFVLGVLAARRGLV